MVAKRLLPIILLCLATSCSLNNKQSASDIEFYNSQKLCKNFYETFPKEFDVTKAVILLKKSNKEVYSWFEKAWNQQSPENNDDLYIEVQKHPCFEYLHRHALSITNTTQNNPTIIRSQLSNALANGARYSMNTLKVDKEPGINFFTFFAVLGALQHNEKTEKKNDDS